MEKWITLTQADSILAQAGQMPFLAELKDGPDNELHLVIQGAVVEENAGPEDPCGNPVLDQILAECKPIVPDRSRRIELIFENYIIYQIRNESYGSYDGSAKCTGTYLMQFETSRFLNYLPVATDACQLEDGSFYPAPWKHYGICTQNHSVDVISQEEPKVLYLENE